MLGIPNIKKNNKNMYLHILSNVFNIENSGYENLKANQHIYA